MKLKLFKKKNLDERKPRLMSDIAFLKQSANGNESADDSERPEARIKSLVNKYLESCHRT